MTAIDQLDELAKKHRCDKGNGVHSYIPTYRDLLGCINVRVLLEIGISGGASLRMWEECFPKARIIGADIRPETLIKTDRISSYYVDQSSSSSLFELGMQIEREVGRPDVIVDDGSHFPDHIATTADVLFPFLRPGGVYVIEDVPENSINLLLRMLPPQATAIRGKTPQWVDDLIVIQKPCEDWRRFGYGE